MADAAVAAVVAGDAVGGLGAYGCSLTLREGWSDRIYQPDQPGRLQQGEPLTGSRPLSSLRSWNISLRIVLITPSEARVLAPRVRGK